jgi:hypothetical protein
LAYGGQSLPWLEAGEDEEGPRGNFAPKMFGALILVLLLFPAQPKLAPIYHPVDHMVPPSFPLLLIVPAAAIDVINWLFTRRSNSAKPQHSAADEPL